MLDLPSQMPSMPKLPPNSVKPFIHPFSATEPLHQQLAALVKLRSHLLTQITLTNKIFLKIAEKLIINIIKRIVSSLSFKSGVYQFPEDDRIVHNQYSW
jgi:hypothetical protein